MMTNKTQVHALRSSQRGSSVFIVMMAILMLTGAGVWAIQSAGLTAQASGNARAANQALLLSEMGIMTTSTYLSLRGIADDNYSIGVQATDTCLSAPDNEFCKRIEMGAVNNVVKSQNSGFDLIEQGAQGSLSPFANTDAAALQGDFFVEMTAPRKAIVQGSDVSKASYQRVTLTSYARIRPYDANLCTGAKGKNAVATELRTRADMIIGPLSGGGSQ